MKSTAKSWRLRKNALCTTTSVAAEAGLEQRRTLADAASTRAGSPPKTCGVAKSAALRNKTSRLYERCRDPLRQAPGAPGRLAAEGGAQPTHGTNNNNNKNQDRTPDAASRQRCNGCGKCAIRASTCAGSAGAARPICSRGSLPRRCANEASRPAGARRRRRSSDVVGMRCGERPTGRNGDASFHGWRLMSSSSTHTPK